MLEIAETYDGITYGEQGSPHVPEQLPTEQEVACMVLLHEIQSASLERLLGMSAKFDQVRGLLEPQNPTPTDLECCSNAQHNTSAVDIHDK